ncbi:hypothetical protein SAMD00019534_111910 [Acytostelium subglobosum LB1]|uniref:hypothetical protein n=1 Tax=Acytostelium subglobosum LB1 TaxID=1410327 RepID=UPI000644AFE6|nr:hypothetical protein SAMD00019534_111910 [Acytostelium subglobosum LB1]GAM28015.1 hypothetical protein SAMD00019534_111910 [Acytostelium subglobosum LB1]|eukprot:XP_012748974.1 hypothetical protein SAMD00019534_111910 [Acytostelium subglobosum LB1]
MSLTCELKDNERPARHQGTNAEDWNPIFEIEAVLDAMDLPVYYNFADKEAYQRRIGQPKAGFTKSHKFINVTQLSPNIDSSYSPKDPTYNVRFLSGTVKFVELIISKPE